MKKLAILFFSLICLALLVLSVKFADNIDKFLAPKPSVTIIQASK